MLGWAGSGPLIVRSILGDSGHRGVRLRVLSNPLDRVMLGKPLSVSDRKTTDSISAWLAPYSDQHCPGIHRRDTGLPTQKDRLDERCRGQNGQSLERTSFARALYEPPGHSAYDARGAFQSRYWRLPLPDPR